MSDTLRSLAQRMIRVDFCIMAALLLLATRSLLTLFVLAPYFVLLLARSALLWSFLRSTRHTDVVSMYSPFAFHRTDRVRRYARLTQHSDLAKWMLYSYAGLVASCTFSSVALIILCVLFSCSIWTFLLHCILIGAVTFSIGTTIEALYARGVVENVESHLHSEQAKAQYAYSKSRYLLDKINVHKKGYLTRRKLAVVEAATRSGLGIGQPTALGGGDAAHESPHRRRETRRQ